MKIFHSYMMRVFFKYFFIVCIGIIKLAPQIFTYLLMEIFFQKKMILPIKKRLFFNKRSHIKNL